MKEYRTIQGDTWDWIAKKVYGNEKRLDVLMENNQDLLDILIFPVSESISGTWPYYTRCLQKMEEKIRIILVYFSIFRI